MKKKILFIYGPLGGGGAERVLIDLLANLDYSRYEVDLCLMVNQGILLPEVAGQVNIIPLWENYSLYYKIAYRISVKLGNNAMFKQVLKKKITKQYDAEISFLEGMPLKLHAMLDSKSKKITWVHVDLFNFPYEAKQFAKGEELAAYNKMDAVICVSNDTLEAFRNRFPTCISDSRVIYNPIDMNKILRMADQGNIERDGIFQVVSVGRLTPQKKLDRVIRLAARMKNEQKQVQFKIVGDGELKEELMALRKELGVEDMVEFTGFTGNPFLHIKNADMMLLSSAFEGFGLVVCEAMCLGVPVVSTKTAGPTEIIHNNTYGLLCDHDDEAIYQAVVTMMDNKNLRAKYKRAGKERVELYSVKNMLEKVDNLING